MRTSLLLTLVITCLSTAALAADAPPQSFMNKGDLVIDGKADSSGTIVVTFQPSGSEPQEFTVNVLNKMKSKEIARDIWKELTIAAGADYKVKLKGDKIVVKKESDTATDFAMQVSANVAGVSILIEN